MLNQVAGALSTGDKKCINICRDDRKVFGSNAHATLIADCATVLGVKLYIPIWYFTKYFYRTEYIQCFKI
ncbi:hypothetical protein BGI39_09135 [Snodgrassella communis]|nr:hypothetical protein BGI39_09135 [Snodgrassella communis]PIT27583.1 hypothetical protein BGI38_05560 [Snodgrassella communis]